MIRQKPIQHLRSGLSQTQSKYVHSEYKVQKWLLLQLNFYKIIPSSIKDMGHCNYCRISWRIVGAISWIFISVGSSSNAKEAFSIVLHTLELSAVK